MVFTKEWHEVLNPKHEARNKSELLNARMFKTSRIILKIFRFGHLNFENLKIVSDFDIRISDLRD